LSKKGSKPAPGDLSTRETERYARHIVLFGMGGAGQQKLKNARVLVVGAGGLGAPVIAYLAGAGVGHLAIADPDEISLSNLQRQIIYTEPDIGAQKAEKAAMFARSLNRDIEIEALPVAINADNGPALFAGYDVIVEGTDTMAARSAIALAAEAAGVALVTGAVSMFDGQITVLAPHLEGDNGKRGPRFSDLYGQGGDFSDLPTCEAVGVLGATTGVIGTLMAMEAIKLICAIGTPLIGRLVLYDGQAGRFSEIGYTRAGE
jgi:molybdopterin-synthase adenylyltransferase